MLKVIQHFTGIQEAEGGSSYDGAPSDIAGPLGGDDHWVAIFEVGGIVGIWRVQAQGSQSKIWTGKPLQHLDFQVACLSSCQLVIAPQWHDAFVPNRMRLDGIWKEREGREPGSVGKAD